MKPFFACYIMRTAPYLLSIVVVGALASRGHGHGNPVKIGLTPGGAGLLVGGGLLLDEGFTAMSFDHSGQSQGDLGFGDTLSWDAPGFELIGDAVGRTVFLEVLSRPDFSATPLQSRWFWYWNDATGQVEATQNDAGFAILSEDGVSELRFSQFTGPTGGDVIELQIVQWGHHAVEFALDDYFGAATGVYGVFGRITSPGLEPSEPFLIALNYGMTDEQFAEGAEQINRAAGIRGDYNYDLAVDGADFLLWQRQVGSLGKLPADGSLNQIVDGADLELWKERFGDRLEATPNAQSVPEPCGGAMLAIAGAALTAMRRARTVGLLRGRESLP